MKSLKVSARISMLIVILIHFLGMGWVLSHPTIDSAGVIMFCAIFLSLALLAYPLSLVFNKATWYKHEELEERRKELNASTDAYMKAVGTLARAALKFEVEEGKKESKP